MADILTTEVTALDENSRILDVREDYEWEAGHIAGALHIPLEQIPARLDELDPDEDLQIICRTGGRSLRATTWLTENGYSATNVAGGMGAWVEAERPMVSENSQPPRVL
ncbi:rhodanese-like domain-containing protein [Arthrobacter sp. H14-L1]|uniref:rhodanese-like domain-containing protein n=1 Tax=Arthrobacter sp. H14-L1 TaxID=2996697 RepID=UPI0022715173|nr:rhodanese-like domain-containing protein [Arthrobacter sp. H14-L1]MCY0904180.1 rhodanese-like domain-containing protein [Arthrobacter sp. H14-L1]